VCALHLQRGEKIYSVAELPQTGSLPLHVAQTMDLHVLNVCVCMCVCVWYVCRCVVLRVSCVLHVVLCGCTRWQGGHGDGSPLKFFTFT